MRAIAAAENHFLRDKGSRGRLIMPCGTGKSLTAYWIAEALKAKTIVVAVPSLGLIRQSVADWTREFLAKSEMPDWICVCSDDSVGNLERDEFVGDVYDLGLPTHMNPKEIASLLRASGKIKIVFTTYQSGDQLVAAARLTGIEFDLAIFDEAHRTVGARSKSFATLLRDQTLKVRYRLFMTATERSPRHGWLILICATPGCREDWNTRYLSRQARVCIGSPPPVGTSGARQPGKPLYGPAL
jgi:predicted helicase